MSFLDDLADFGSSILDVGKSVGSWLGGGSIAANLAKTAITGFALNKVTSAINKENTTSSVAKTTRIDPGVRLQVDPDPTHKIPVVYGSAHLGAIITDAQISDDNKTMYYCLTICEKTGNLNLGQGSPSSFTFVGIYWDDQQIVFQNDGITASHSLDRGGNQDTSIKDLVKVWCYNGNSSSPVCPTGYVNNSLPAAYSVMKGWTSNHSMNDLIFAIVQITYNKENGITKIPNIRFHVENSMYLPGDCVYDYATNTRYGAGIDPQEIYSI